MATTAVWTEIYGRAFYKTLQAYGSLQYLLLLELLRNMGWTISLGDGSILLCSKYVAELIVLPVVDEDCVFLSSRCSKIRDAITFIQKDKLEDCWRDCSTKYIWVVQ